MPDSADSNSPILAAYLERTPGSRRLAAEAGEVFPSGVTHDIRFMKPYGIFVERAQGPRKWDVDGNAYIDYFGGHGALLLGHNHPAVVAATHAALDRGTHFGANHAGEVRWGRLVQQLVPSAERVRFTASGTEATLMALRLARAFTGRRKIIRFLHHFHGWHDHMASGYASHFDGTPVAGTLADIAASTVLLPQGDVAALRAALADDADIAAAIIEPTGAAFGTMPLDPAFLLALREETAKRGVLLILDEVITGFRVSPGGMQGELGIRPDLTTLAKILAGGLPGGAVGGRRDIMDELDFEAMAKKGREKIGHPGTFNANPLSAAAGGATLEIVAGTDACAQVNRQAARLRARLNAVLAEERLPWAVYGSFSSFHLFVNPNNRAVAPLAFDAAAIPPDEIAVRPPALVQKLRMAMLVQGVDVNNRLSGMLSTAHGDAEIEATGEAFARALAMLRAEGELPQG